MKRAFVSAAELREQFDRSFSEAHAEAPVFRDVLAVQVAGHPYAIRVEEIRGLFVDRPVVPLPTQRAGLVGLAGFRGVILPVFDLAVVLGHPAGSSPRWTVAAKMAPIAFAFDVLDRYMRVPRDSIVAHASADPNRTGDVVRDQGVLRPVIALDTLTAALALPHQEP